MMLDGLMPRVRNNYRSKELKKLMRSWYVIESIGKAKRDLMLNDESSKSLSDKYNELVITYCPPFEQVKKDEINSLAKKLEALKDV